MITDVNITGVIKNSRWFWGEVIKNSVNFVTDEDTWVKMLPYIQAFASGIAVLYKNQHLEKAFDFCGKDPSDFRLPFQELKFDDASEISEPELSKVIDQVIVQELTHQLSLMTLLQKSELLSQMRECKKVFGVAVLKPFTDTDVGQDSREA